MPKGMTATKATIQVKDGQVFQYWAKTELDRDIDVVKAAITAFVEPLPELVQQEYVENGLETDIIPWFQIGDAHIGMIAYAAEVNTHPRLRTMCY
jgi:hypothetical protein